MDQSRYQTLTFSTPSEGVLELSFDNPKTLNSIGITGHREIGEVWRDVDADPEIRAVLITGKGRAFCAGGDYELIGAVMSDRASLARTLSETCAIVYGMIDCSKPIVSAINGAAAGLGAAIALLADIPVAARSARIIDGHTSIGVAAGDHAAIIWPLLCGMAKAKYYLLLNEPLSGEEAERIGLVAKVVDDDQLYPAALQVAQKLARGSATAIRWTKQSLNNWLRSAAPAFEASLAWEGLGWTGPDAREGLAALREKRVPRFTG